MSQRIKKERVRTVLNMAKKGIIGYTPVPKNIIEKYGIEETVIVEIPTAWLFQKAKTRKKQKTKTLTLGDVLPS